MSCEYTCGLASRRVSSVGEHGDDRGLDSDRGHDRDDVGRHGGGNLRRSVVEYMVD